MKLGDRYWWIASPDEAAAYNHGEAVVEPRLGVLVSDDAPWWRICPADATPDPNCCTHLHERDLYTTEAEAWAAYRAHLAELVPEVERYLADLRQRIAKIDGAASGGASG